MMITVGRPVIAFCFSLREGVERLERFLSMKKRTAAIIRVSAVIAVRSTGTTCSEKNINVYVQSRRDIVIRPLGDNQYVIARMLYYT